MVNKPQRPLIVDGSTYASSPGNLHVDYFYWIRSFPSKPIQLILPLTILVALAFFTNWIFGFAFFGILRKGKSLHLLPSALFGIAVFNIFFGIGIFQFLKQLIFLAIRIREQFLYGCVNPGIVVTSKPPLIAVFTDLTTGKAPHHAIKILPQPLQWMKNGVPPVGTRLATVALYEGNLHKGYWDDFYPIVVDCVTGNQTDTQRVLQSIPDWEWEQLEAGLGYLRTTKPGLYTIPFVRCAFCHQLIFLPLYPMHREKHTEPLADGQMTDHVTIHPERRYQGVLDVVPQAYIHTHCGGMTKMPEEIIRSYLVNPFLYNEYTFCCGCNNYIHQQELYWCETGQCLADYFQELQQEYIRIHGDPPPNPFV